MVHCTEKVVTIRNISLTILYSLLFLTVCAICGAIVSVYYGAAVTLLLGILYLIFVFCLGDRFILARLRARPWLGSKSLLEEAKNYSCRLGIGEVNLYVSSKYHSNVYFLESFSGTPSLVIGKKLLKNFSDSEIETAILLGLFRIQSGVAKYWPVIGLLLTVPFVPLIYLRNKTQRFPRLSLVLEYYLSPLFFARRLIFRNRDEIIDHDKKLVVMTENSRDLMSIIHKIGRLNGRQEQTMISMVIENLAIVDNYNNNIVSDLTKLHFPPNERCLTILSSR